MCIKPRTKSHVALGTGTDWASTIATYQSACSTRELPGMGSAAAQQNVSTTPAVALCPRSAIYWVTRKGMTDPFVMLIN